ncbi:hypothetical protein F3Y22_tig00111957pilonHSYRG00029 [Hibiscus syriacus]|uniref:Smr domain-containing protein n=1 Tax=Hibiscus syriacus TaxID=106335 RepID=A0A6A2XNF2_HIBSY|nr:hypothetical protein F3Y22_tig00111957pilonHSYRG00029 [Hibiscus syriacus]
MLMFKSSSSLPSRISLDFASAGRKMEPQDSGIWKYDSADSIIGPSRSSHGSTNSYSALPVRGVYASRLHARDSAPVWLETGDAVGTLSICHRQQDSSKGTRCERTIAQYAYEGSSRKGSRTYLSPELSLSVMILMNTAWNPVPPENIRGQERMIDLPGLHIPEAIHLLKHELSVLRRTDGADDQRLQVYIYVGTGHHTNSRTRARLPVAVQRYLLEEECLDYSEPQPGLFRVVIY